MENPRPDMTPIAHFRSAFPTKFGIPRQSGIVGELHGRIGFVPEFRNMDALRGLEGFDYLWIIWQFSANRPREERGAASWQPTVRPPLLGGNTPMGVFATRSPYRPNPIGLSSARIGRIELSATEGPVIHVFGADLMDGTPIYDIKPYLSFSDSHPQAKSGFAEATQDYQLAVIIDENMLAKALRCGAPWDAIQEILRQDPRPAYQNDQERIYHLDYDHWAVDFTVNNATVCVKNIAKK